ncbi:hypothetical protein GJV03_08145 [Acinetobacter sp. RIT698]|uniref:hypothetical protein n=1 Tax=Acinetobacter sp. RIT698 TaxID=2666192 RepID=UPI0012ACAC94|nr:hypothetical protein [Acinetobacter sp. RIT698]MRT37128.1 hypothetical protein [Acinetobacter sp. RIT698]
MKNIILVISLFVCGYANAYQKEDFEKNYAELSEKLESSVSQAVGSMNGDNALSKNMFCLKNQAKLNFQSYLIDNFEDYENMLKSNNIDPPSKSEFQGYKAQTISEIEDNKKDLVGTKYNCTPE